VRLGRWQVALACIIPACLVPLQGCGQDDEGPPAGGSFDKRVMELPWDSTVGSVKDGLGNPVTEFIDVDGEGTLNYPGWRLGFIENGLEYKSKELAVARPQRRSAANDLGTGVLALRRGLTLKEVITRLGKPDVEELLFEEGSPPERILRYGPWELRFTAGKLRMRTRW
jgi:hypothetical protein